MKRDINLLDELLRETRTPLATWRLVSVAGAGILVPVLGWGLQVRAANHLDPQVVELRASRDRLTQEADQARAGIAGLIATNARRAAERARAESLPWSDAFRELSFVVPSGVWLTVLEEAAHPDGTDAADVPFRLQGTAVSQGAVAELLANLETAQHFSEPLLVYSQREVGGRTAHVGFEIQCGLRRIIAPGGIPERRA